MNNILQPFDFPQQRIPDKDKTIEWAAKCCDWVIAQGVGIKDSNEMVKKYNILHGEMPEEYYKKTLNPYNATKEKYKRFPATLRNYDMLKGIIRRYVSEYIKNPHEFTVSANNPEIILAKNAKLRQELHTLVQNAIAAEIQKNYQQFINEGNDPNQFNPQESINVEAFVKQFNENYIDEKTVQGQHLLNVIRDITNDEILYARVYFDFVSFGECYTYSDVVGDKLIKRNVSALDAFPIPNDSMFVEDYDMFAERIKMTYQQIIDNFDEYLTEKQRKFIEDYYGYKDDLNVDFNYYKVFEDYFPDVCNKFSKTDRELFKKDPPFRRDTNTGLYDVWHVVWRGEKRVAIVTYVNELNIITEKVEDDDYKLNKDAGDISIEYVYKPQVYEAVRIGGRTEGIYPYGARAIAFNRNGKLPYNGIYELLPGFGKFSIIEEVTPYQVFYNIVAYHREMIIAKNKLFILMIAKSLLGTNSEDTIYKMLADNMLIIDDENDAGMLKAQQTRILTASMGDYISQLTALMDSIEEKAKNQVDMTPQRYGAIANSAGKGVTEEAIIRGSMGSVIIEFIVDKMRELDYARDLDYTKLAWIDGLNTSYRDDNNQIKYISLDINSHIYSDYTIRAKNSAKEIDKLEQLKNYAFSAAQNGQDEMAIAAIMGDSSAEIKKMINNFSELKHAHEKELQAMEQQTEQMKQQFELEKIKVKGEEDRKTKELEAYLDKEIELIRADANLLSYNSDISDKSKNEAQERLNEARNEIEKERLKTDKQRMLIDAYNKEEDRKLKREQIAAQVKVAKTNKNKYDK